MGPRKRKSILNRLPLPRSPRAPWAEGCIGVFCLGEVLDLGWSHLA